MPGACCSLHWSWRGRTGLLGGGGIQKDGPLPGLIAFAGQVPHIHEEIRRFAVAEGALAGQGDQLSVLPGECAAVGLGEGIAEDWVAPADLLLTGDDVFHGFNDLIGRCPEYHIVLRLICGNKRISVLECGYRLSKPELRASGPECGQACRI